MAGEKDPMSRLQEIAGDEMVVQTEKIEEVEPVVVEEPPVDSEATAPPKAEPAAEGEETPPVSDSPILEGMNEALQELDAGDQEVQETASEKREQIGTLLNAIAPAFADSELTEDEVRSMVLAPFSSEAVDYTVKMNFPDRDVFDKLVNQLLQTLNELRAEGRRGIGINALFTALDKQNPGSKQAIANLKDLFKTTFVLTTMLEAYTRTKTSKLPEESYSDLEGGPSEGEAASEEAPAQEEVDKSVAAMADALADDLEPEEESVEEKEEAAVDAEEPETEEPPAEEPPVVEVTEADIAAAEGSGVTMAPTEVEEGEKITIEEADLPAEAEARAEVTQEQFLQLARSEKYNPAVFYTKFLNNEGHMNHVAELLQQYSDSAITAEELRSQIIEYGIEQGGISTRVGTTEPSKPELTNEFFDELLGVETRPQEERSTAPLLSGSGGRNLLPALKNAVSQVLPDGLRFWGRSEQNIDDMTPAQLAKRMNITEEKATQILEKRRQRKEGGEEPATAEETPVPVEEVEEPEAEESPEVEEPEQDEAVQEAESTKEAEKKNESKVEIPAEIQEQVREMLQKKEYDKLRIFFLDQMTEAADTELYEPLSKAFQAVAKFLK